MPVAGELCCVVVDELHMVSDPQRGLPLELSLTKLLFAKLPALQIIGMSATMGGEPVSCTTCCQFCEGCKGPKGDIPPALAQPSMHVQQRAAGLNA